MEIFEVFPIVSLRGIGTGIPIFGPEPSEHAEYKFSNVQNFDRESPSVQTNATDSSKAFCERVPKLAWNLRGRRFDENKHTARQP
jgi:hypothetical protein